MTIWKRTAITGLIAATAVVLAGCGSSDSPPTTEPSHDTGTFWATPATPVLPSDDDLYITTLDQEGITYTSEQDAITAGHAVCTYLEGGFSEVDAAVVFMQNTSYTPYEAGYIVGAAHGAFCPEVA